MRQNYEINNIDYRLRLRLLRPRGSAANLLLSIETINMIISILDAARLHRHAYCIGFIVFIVIVAKDK